MGNVFTLDALREEVEKEFAPIELVVSDGTTVTLRNLLRLPKKERDQVLAKLKVLESLDKSGESQDANEVDLLASTAVEILVLVSDHGKKLADELGDDLSIILKVLSVWMESSQPGEAEPSPSS
jgi:Mycobacteriophage tail assembly protein